MRSMKIFKYRHECVESMGTCDASACAYTQTKRTNMHTHLFAFPIVYGHHDTQTRAYTRWHLTYQ